MWRDLKNFIALAVFAAVVMALGVVPAAAAERKFDTSKIEEITGARGNFNDKEGAFVTPRPSRITRTPLACPHEHEPIRTSERFIR